MTTSSTSSPTVALAIDDEALAGFRRVLRNLAAAIDANLEGTVTDADPEFLHELRVAVRRTRSVLAQGKGVLPPDVRDRYRESFGWLGQVTGPARDLDVHVLGWDDYLAPLSDVDRRALDRVLAEVEARRRDAHTELADVLQSDTTRDLLATWRSWLTDPDVEATDPQPLGPFVARRIAKAQDNVLRDGRSIDPTTPAERLHDLRKDTKKLRYLLECFGGLFKAKPLGAFVSQLKALQDNLGEHQDAEVHLGQLQELAHQLHERATVDAEALHAIDRLGDHLDRRRRHERERFAKRFAAYDRKANRKTLDTLLRRAAKAT
ncbi:MAG: CHAD domain-containing protein [Acidimicrobiales bacterium]